ncbi:MAG: non-homologous end joining protein Ku [Candidatus Binatia bacterium]|nr:MAG: non-homologous end joining protein Ku [Candidatus Binatia bacterium]
MPRAIQSATISFGLVAVPVKLFPARQPKTISFRLLHAKDHSRLRQQYVCQTCNQVVERSEMIKGYEYAKDRFVLFTEEEIRALDEASSQTIEIEEFVPLASVDPVFFENAYLLGPEKAGQKAYHLLAAAMREAGMVAVGRFSTRGREPLVLLRETHGGLMLHYLAYADEVVGFSEIDLGDGVQFKEGELDLAVKLVRQLASESFDATKYEDTYRKKLLAAVDQKLAGQQVALAPARAPKAQIIDLMEALKASLEAREKEAAPGRKPARGKGQKAEPRPLPRTKDAS